MLSTGAAPSPQSWGGLGPLAAAASALGEEQPSLGKGPSRKGSLFSSSDALKGRVFG